MQEQGWQKVCFRESNPLRKKNVASASPRHRNMQMANRGSPRQMRIFDNKGQSVLRPFKHQTQKEQQQVVFLHANGGPQQRILVSPGWRIEDDLQKLSLTKRFIEQSPRQQLKPDTAHEIERQLKQHFKVINESIQLNKDLLIHRGGDNQEIATQTPHNNGGIQVDPDTFTGGLEALFQSRKPPVVVPQTTVIINPSALEGVERMMAESLLNAPLNSGQMKLAASASPTSLIRNSSGEVAPDQVRGTSGSGEQDTPTRFTGGKHKSVTERRETNFSDHSTKLKDEQQTQKRSSVQDRTNNNTLHENNSDKNQTVCEQPRGGAKIDTMMSQKSRKQQRQSVARSVYGGGKQARARRASNDSETESESSLQQVGVGAMIIVQPNQNQQVEKPVVESPKRVVPQTAAKDMDQSTVIHVTSNDGASYMQSVNSAGAVTRQSYSYVPHRQTTANENSAKKNSPVATGTSINPSTTFALPPPTVNVALGPGQHSPLDLRIHSAGFPEQKRLAGKDEHKKKYKEFQAKVQEREEEFKSHNELDFKFMQNSPYNFQDILERLHSQEKARTRKKGEKFAQRACDLHRDQLLSNGTEQNFTQLVMANGNVTMTGNGATASSNQNEQSVKDINIKVNDKEIDLPTEGSMDKNSKEGFAFKSSVTSIPYHYARSSGLSSHGVKQAAASLSSVLQTNRPINKNNFSSCVNQKLNSGQNKKRAHGDGTVMLTPDKQTTELIKGSETLQEQINEIKVQAGSSEQEMQDNHNTLQQVTMDVSYRKGEQGAASSVDSGLINIKLENAGKNGSGYPSSKNINSTINTHNNHPQPPPSPDSKTPQRKSVLSHLAASRDSVRQKDAKSPKPLKDMKGTFPGSVGSDKIFVDQSPREKVPVQFMKKRISNQGQIVRIHHQTTAQIVSQQVHIPEKKDLVADSFQEQRRTSNDSVNTNQVVTEGNSVFTQKQLLEKSMDGAPASNIQEFDMQSNKFTERALDPAIDEDTAMGDTDRNSPTQNSSVAGFGLSYNKLKFKDCGMISNVIIKQKKSPHQSPKKSPIRKQDYMREDSIFFSKQQGASGDNFLRGQSILWTGCGDQSSKELSLQRKKEPKNASFVVVPQVWRRDQHHSQQQQPEFDLTVKRTFIVPLNLQHQNSLYFMRDKRGELQSNPSTSQSRVTAAERTSKVFPLKGTSTAATAPSFNATTPQFNTSGFKFSVPSDLQLMELQKTSERTPKNMIGTTGRRRSSTLKQDPKASHNSPSYFFQSNAMSPAENFEQQATAFLKNSQQKMASLHPRDEVRTTPNMVGATPTKKTPKTSYQSLRGEAYYYHVASPFPQGAKNQTGRLALRTQDGTTSKDNLVLSTPNQPPHTPKDLQLNSEGNPGFQQNRDIIKQQRANALRRQQILAAQGVAQRRHKVENGDISAVQASITPRDEQSKHTTESKASQIDFPSQTSQPLFETGEEERGYVESLGTQKVPFQPFSDAGVYRNPPPPEHTTEYSRDLMMIQTPNIPHHQEMVNDHSPMNLTHTSQNQFVKTASYADKRTKNLRKWEGRQHQLVGRIERAFGATSVKRSPTLRSRDVCTKYVGATQQPPFRVGQLNEDSIDSSNLQARSVPRQRNATFGTTKRSKWQNLIDNIAMGGCPEETFGTRRITVSGNQYTDGKTRDGMKTDSEQEPSIQLSDMSKVKSPAEKKLNNQTSWLLPELLHSELAKNSPKRNSLASKLSPFMFNNKETEQRHISPQTHKVNFLTGAKIFKR